MMNLDDWRAPVRSLRSEIIKDDPIGRFQTRGFEYTAALQFPQGKTDCPATARHGGFGMGENAQCGLQSCGANPALPRRSAFDAMGRTPSLAFTPKKAPRRLPESFGNTFNDRFSGRGGGEQFGGRA